MREFDLRLVDGTTSVEGRVEMFYEGEWGTVCRDFFGKTEEAAVACHQLGFLYVEKITSFGPGEGRVLLSNLNCNGNEERLVECYHNRLGKYPCDHERDLGVICSNVDSSTSPPKLSPGESSWLCYRKEQVVI